MAMKSASSLKSYDYYQSLLGNPNVQAALNTIAYAEGLSKVKDPYSTLVGYGTFADQSKHPGIAVQTGYGRSTAAGKYQALKGTWNEVAKAVGIPDFTPTSQDVFAVARLDQRGALKDVLDGNLKGWTDKARNEWASLPTSELGQGRRSQSQIEKAYKAYLETAKNTPAFMNGFRQDPVAVKTIDGVRSLSKSLDQASIPSPLSREYSRFNDIKNVPTPQSAPPPMSAAPTSDFRAPPAPLTITPNKVNTFTFTPTKQAPAINPSEISRMRDNLASRMAFAMPNPSNMNISGYGFATPAKAAGPSATGSASGSINRASAVGNVAVPSRTGGVLGGRGNINPPNVVSPPANALPNFDENGRFTGNRSPFGGFSLSNVTSFAPGPTTSNVNRPSTSMDSVARQAQNATRQSQQNETWRDVAAKPQERLQEAARPMAPAGTPANMGAAGYGLARPSVPPAASMQSRVVTDPRTSLQPQRNTFNNPLQPAVPSVVPPAAPAPISTASPMGKSLASAYSAYAAARGAPLGGMLQAPSQQQRAAPQQQRTAPIAAPARSSPQISNEPQYSGRTPGDRARSESFQPGGFFGATSQAARGGIASWGG